MAKRIIALPIPGVQGQYIAGILRRGDLILTPIGNCRVSKVIPIPRRRRVKLILHTATYTQHVITTTHASLWYTVTDTDEARSAYLAATHRA